MYKKHFQILQAVLWTCLPLLLSACSERIQGQQGRMMGRNFGIRGGNFGLAEGPQTEKSGQFTSKLAIPPLLDTSKGKVVLRAQRASHEFRTGVSSPTMGYNGSFLGPTILLHRGSNAEIEIVNQLNEATTLHSHGAIIPGAMDGGPQRLIAPGASWTLHFPVRQEAATLWYHPHRMGATASQVWAGLAGMYIIEDETPAKLPRNYGVNDIPIIVQERILDNQGRMLPYERVEGHMTTMNGASGNTFLVNGQLRPQLTAARGWLRLRLLNGSNASSYRFSFTNQTKNRSKRTAPQEPFYQIASEQGLLVRPVQLKSIDLTTGGRVELMIQLPPEEAQIDLNVSIWDRNLDSVSRSSYSIMRIQVDPKRTPEATQLPEILRGSARLPISSEEQEAIDLQNDRGLLAQLPQREMSLNMMRGMQSMMSQYPYGINGQAFQMDTINFHVPRPEGKRYYEVWRFNTDMLGHPVHIHGLRFRVLQSAWENEGSPYWHDTFTLNTRDDALVLVQFPETASADFPYMLHCHMLEHEDAGMMAQFTVG